jgi:hypothetical protein
MRIDAMGMAAVALMPVRGYVTVARTSVTGR